MQRIELEKKTKSIASYSGIDIAIVIYNSHRLAIMAPMHAMVDKHVMASYLQ